MKVFPSSTAEILFFLFTFAVPGPLLLGNCDHEVTAILNQSGFELLTVSHQKKKKQYFNRFTFLRVLFFPFPAPFPITSYYETSNYQHWIFKSLSIKKRKANLFLKGYFGK